MNDDEPEGMAETMALLDEIIGDGGAKPPAMFSPEWWRAGYGQAYVADRDKAIHDLQRRNRWAWPQNPYQTWEPPKRVRLDEDS